MIEETDEIIERFREHLDRQGFNLGRKLGSGSFGTVYKAEQRSLVRSVAVKIFTGDRFPIAPDVKERFEREARLLSKVEHPSLPYVVTVGAVKSDEGQIPYIVMQYISGGSLDDLLVKEKKLPVGSASEIIVQLLGGLEALHKRQILHRDIKPNNILLSQGRAVLIDFSLGVSLKYEPGLTRGTMKGQGLGVPDYASPEQQADAQSCDGRADLYSVGVVLFELLAGHTRFNLNDLENQLGTGADALASVIRRACQADREKRYSNAAEFRDALNVFLVAGSHLDQDEGPGLCPNTSCSAASWSNNNYFFGPRFEEHPTRFCEGCGGRFLRRCTKCSAPLPASSRNRVTRNAKSEPNAGSLFCVECGHLIFEAPVCKTCGSLLKKEDMGVDTEEKGCEKCRQRKAAQSFDPDDDIPF